MRVTASYKYYVTSSLPDECPQRVLNLNPWILSYVSKGTFKAKQGDKSLFFTSGDVQLFPLQILGTFDLQEVQVAGAQEKEIISLFIFPKFLKNLTHNFPEFGEVVAHIQHVSGLVRYDALPASRIIEKLESMRPLSAAERIPVLLDILCLL